MEDELEPSPEDAKIRTLKLALVDEAEDLLYRPAAVDEGAATASPDRMHLCAPGSNRARPINEAGLGHQSIEWGS
jgi:hypothetical protein